MILKKGGVFLDRVNEIIYRLVESGISAYFVNFGTESKEFFKAKSSASRTESDEYCALPMNHIQSAFYLLLFRHALCLISFLMVMYFKMQL
jgi:hypothetical protein